MITHLIDGRQVESRETFSTFNPATGEVLAEVASGGQEEVKAAVAAAKAASRVAMSPVNSITPAGNHATRPPSIRCGTSVIGTTPANTSPVSTRKHGCTLG